jgi:hypothetical protein
MSTANYEWTKEEAQDMNFGDSVWLLIWSFLICYLMILFLGRGMAARHTREVRSARAPTAIAAVALLCAVASCTGSTQTQTSPATSSAAPTTTAQNTACADVAALKSSLEALTKVKPAQDGVTALTTAIANVKTSLDAAEASASPVLQPSVQQVKTAFAALQTAASGVTKDNIAQKAPAIASAMKQVGTATAAFRTTLAESCPGS